MTATAFDTLVRALDACRIIDLSSDVANHAKGPFHTELEVLEPKPGARFFVEHVLPGLVPNAVGHLRPEHFPDGSFLRHEMVRASVHAGSHVDAPGHYGPGTASGGSELINAAPLRAFIRPGVLLDASDVPDLEIAPHHVEAARADLEHKIVLIRTGEGKAISAELVESLLDAGVSVIGTDSDSFDGPFPRIIERFLATGDRGVLWPCHMLGRRRPYYQLERLRNLESLPSSGFVVCAMPVLISGATAAWTRAVAFVPEEAAEMGRSTSPQ